MRTIDPERHPMYYQLPRMNDGDLLLTFVIISVVVSLFFQ